MYYIIFCNDCLLLFRAVFMTVNQRVAGSSPAGGAKRKKVVQTCTTFFVARFRGQF